MSISKKYKFPIVFAAHIRWCIVLAKLKELDLDYKIQQTREAFAIKPKDKKLKTTLESLEKDQKSKLSVNDLVKTLGLESISDQSPEGNLSRTDWDQWF